MLHSAKRNIFKSGEHTDPLLIQVCDPPNFAINFIVVFLYAVYIHLADKAKQN